MSQSQANVVAPNKHTSSSEGMYGGRLLDSETYIGGKVEALESGVFRSDLPCKFKLSAEAYQVRGGVYFEKEEISTINFLNNCWYGCKNKPTKPSIVNQTAQRSSPPP